MSTDESRNEHAHASDVLVRPNHPSLNPSSMAHRSAVLTSPISLRANPLMVPHPIYRAIYLLMPLPMLHQLVLMVILGQRFDDLRLSSDVFSYVMWGFMTSVLWYAIIWMMNMYVFFTGGFGHTHVTKISEYVILATSPLAKRIDCLRWTFVRRLHRIVFLMMCASAWLYTFINMWQYIDINAREIWAVYASGYVGHAILIVMALVQYGQFLLWSTRSGREMDQELEKLAVVLKYNKAVFERGMDYIKAHVGIDMVVAFSIGLLVFLLLCLFM